MSCTSTQCSIIFRATWKKHNTFSYLVTRQLHVLYEFVNQADLHIRHIHTYRAAALSCFISTDVSFFRCQIIEAHNKTHTNFLLHHMFTTVLLHVLKSLSNRYEKEATGN